MDNNYRFSHIGECLALVESRFNRGTREQWTNYDFEKLSDEIQQATDVMLSITTLKRVFGKVKYDHAPSTATLNALAKYAGFSDWGTFRAKAATEEEHFEKPKKERSAGYRPWSKRWFWWTGSVVIVLFLLFFLAALPSRHSPVTSDPGAYSFSSNKVLTAGVPNSVIFHYDASAAANDSVYIAQNWDTRRKKRVSKTDHTYSSVYYYPGFFRAQLIVGGKSVKHHDLLIASVGWLAAAEKPDVPVYFKKEEFQKDSMVEVTAALLDTYHLALQPQAPTIRFCNVREMPGLSNDNFTFETTLKSEFEAGTAACQYVEILILCKNDVIIIPVCRKGCVGNLRLYAAGRELSSGKDDLSGFGCDPANWVTLRVESVRSHMRFIVNGKDAAELDFPNPPSGIVGVAYRFTGPAAIKNAVFLHGDQKIKLL